MISSKIIKVLKSPRIGLSRIWMIMSPMIQSSEFYLKVYYRLRTGRKLNLDHPRSFQEKTQWLKLHNTDPLFSKLVDKYEVRKFVAERIGEEHLIPLYGVYDSFDQIDFNNLPNQFVLKSTHDSGSVVICRDKGSFNVGRARRKLHNSLKRNYFYDGREYPYKNVKPRIVAEKYMEDANGGQLPDYKFFTFNGKPEMLFVAEGRFSREGAKFTFFDLNWNELPLHAKGHTGDGKPTELTAPDCFDEMKEIVKKLCLDIPFVRIDLYTVNNKIYFGEYTTFHHDGGVVDYEPAEWNDKLGNMIIFPIDK